MWQAEVGIRVHTIKAKSPGQELDITDVPWNGQLVSALHLRLLIYFVSAVTEH